MHVQAAGIEWFYPGKIQFTAELKTKENIEISNQSFYTILQV